MCFTTNLRYLRTLPTGQRLNSRPHVAQGYDSIRRSIVLKAMSKHCPEPLIQEVKAQRRSEVTDEKLMEDFFKNEQPEVNLRRDFHYRKALRKMRQLFAPKQLYKPVAFPDLRYYPWRLQVSAESPYTFANFWNDYLRNKEMRGEINSHLPTFHNLYDELFVKNRNLIHMIKHKHHAFFEADGTPRPYYWVNLHARAHVVGPDEDDKVRAVFGVPKLLLFAENMFIWPMMADLLNRDPAESPMLWGTEIMRGGWHKLRNLIINKTGGHFKTVLSADWSQFDRRALFSIIDDIHDTWHSFFDWSGEYQPTNFYPNAKTDPSKLQNIWDWYTFNVKHYPIALPNGDLYQWTRNGIASGFQETQLLDSWVNGIMLLTCLSELGVDIDNDKFFLKLQGDDSLCAFTESYARMFGKRFLRMMSEIAARRFNAKLSVDKSDIHDRTLDDVYVLGYYNKSGIAYRTDVDLLSHLLFPERSQDLRSTAASAIGIALAAMGCSKLVYDVCKDVYDFITIELRQLPRWDAHTASSLMYKMGIYVSPFDDRHAPVQLFPSFFSTYLQNFTIEGRPESDRQRTWPTDPTRTGGFCFL